MDGRIEEEKMRSILQIQAEMIDQQKELVDLAQEKWDALFRQTQDREVFSAELHLRCEKALDRKFELQRKYSRMLDRKFGAIDWLKIISELLLDRFAS